MSRFIFIFSFLLVLVFNAFSQGYEFQQQNNIPVIIKNDTLKGAWAGGINSSTLSTYDFDQDGVSDILLFDRENNRNLVFLVKSGKPIFSLLYQGKLPALSRYGLFYDFDKDGKKDLFTSVQNGIKVFKNLSQLTDLAFKDFKSPLFTNYYGDYINMDLSNLDVPAFTDIDNDGDMDILHFRSSQGTSIDLEKNMSVENFNKPDSLLFKNLDNCWGGVMEQSCNYYNFGFACKNNFRLEHIGGGAVLAFDSDNDLNKDLLLGKEDCNNLNFLQNKGTNVKPVFTKSSSVYPGVNSPHLPYALPFNEDVDGDNIKDLVVTMGNSNDTCDFINSIWLYKNTGTNTNANFIYQSKNFIQNTMMDIGRNSVPCFLDLDGDGDIDLLVAGSSSKGITAGIYKFLNTGNMQSPVYTLSDTNFLQQKERNLDGLNITVSDLNNDNKADLILSSEKNGILQVEWFVNSSSKGFASSYSKLLDVKLSSLFSLLFTDVDGNGLEDILVGSKSGDLKYFINSGTSVLPKFNLIDSAYGGIKSNITSSNGNLSLAIEDIDKDNKMDLVTVNDSGFVFVYPGFKNQDPKNFTDKYILATNNGPIGKKLRLVFSDLNNDKVPEAVIGNQNGGLFLFKLSTLTTNLTYSDGNLEYFSTKIFPNPSSGTFSVENNKNISIKIVDFSGLELFRYDKFDKSDYSLEILKPGIYLIITETEGQTRQCQKLAVK